MRAALALSVLALAACGDSQKVTGPPPDPYSGPCSGAIHEAIAQYGEPTRVAMGTTEHDLDFVVDGDTVTFTFIEHFEQSGPDWCETSIQL